MDHKLKTDLMELSVRNEEFKHGANYIPDFGLFNDNRNLPKRSNPTKQTYNYFFNKPPSSTGSEPSISNSRSESSSTLRWDIPQAKAFSSNSNNPTKPTKKTNETTTGHKIKSRTFTSTGGQKSGDNELNYLTSKMDDCQISWEEVSSIGCSEQSSLLPLIRGIRCLCDYLSNLSSERRQLESKILHQNFISRNNYPVLCKRGIWNRITDLKKLLCSEISLSLQFISDYKNYLDFEGEKCTVNLLNELASYTEKLSAFEHLRIFQRNGLVHAQGDHIQQLERLLSEINSLLPRCIEMFFIMKYYGALGYRRNLRVGTRQYRSKFFG